MDELNSMGVEDVGVVVGYLSGKAKGEEKVIQRNKRLKGGSGSSTEANKDR